MKFSKDTSRLVEGKPYWCATTEIGEAARVEYSERMSGFGWLWGDECPAPTVEVEPEPQAEPALLPCPFCGGTSVYPSPSGGFIACECGATGPWKPPGPQVSDPSKATIAWNTRAAPAPAEPPPPTPAPPVCPAGQVYMDEDDAVAISYYTRPLRQGWRYPPPAWPPRIGEIVEVLVGDQWILTWVEESVATKTYTRTSQAKRCHVADRIAEIEARLQAATPGPWLVEGSNHIRAANGDVVAEYAYEDPDADLIAHAQDDLRYLLDDLAKARAACAAYERVWWMAERYAEGGGSGGPEQRDLDEARAEIERLRAERITEGAR